VPAALAEGDLGGARIYNLGHPADFIYFIYFIYSGGSFRR